MERCQKNLERFYVEEDTKGRGRKKFSLCDFPHWQYLNFIAITLMIELNFSEILKNPTKILKPPKKNEIECGSSSC